MNTQVITANKKPFYKERLRKSLQKVSIICPIGPGEQSWQSLWSEFPVLYRNLFEWIFVSIEGQANPGLFPEEALVFESKKGRGIQLNSGANKASREYLWFLHADSLISEDNLLDLASSIAKNTGVSDDHLFYYDLKFMDGESSLLKLNEFFLKFRSDCLGIPFGDQGFFIQKSLFEHHGGYIESDSKGEDLEFVWRLRTKGVKVCNSGSSLFSSARKYNQNGWLNITVDHLLFTIKKSFFYGIKFFLRYW